MPFFHVFSNWRKGEAGSIQGNMVADNLGPTWIILTWIWTRTSNTQNFGDGQNSKKSENPKNGRFLGTKSKKKMNPPWDGLQTWMVDKESMGDSCGICVLDGSYNR